MKFLIIGLLVIIIVFGIKFADLKSENKKLLNKLKQLKDNGRVSQNDYNFVINPKYINYYIQPSPQNTLNPNNQFSANQGANNYSVPVQVATPMQNLESPVTQINNTAPFNPYNNSQPMQNPIPQQPSPLPTHMPTPQPTPMPKTVLVQQVTTNVPEEKRGVSTINVILVIGTLFIILSGLIFATTTWEALSNGLRGGMIFTLTALFFVASEVAERKFMLDKTGVAFFTLGSIFMPITLIAVGFFKLFGEWFSFYGDGKYILLGLTFTLLCGSTAVGTIKYQIKQLAFTSLLSMSAAITCFALAISGWTDIFTLIISVYSAAVIFSDKLVRKITSYRFELFLSQWNIFSVCNVIFLSVFGVIFSGNGIFAFISVALFSILFLDRRFTSMDNGYGIFPFAAGVIVSIYKILRPESADGFTFIGAVTATIIFLLGLTNFYSEKAKKLFGILSGVFVTLSFVIGGLYVVKNEWTYPLLISVLVLTATSLFCTVVRKIKPLGILFTLLSMLFLNGVQTLFLSQFAPSIPLMSLGVLVLFVVLFFVKNPIRSAFTDLTFCFGMLVAFLINNSLALETGSMEVYVESLVSASVMAILFGFTTVDNKYGIWSTICRYIFPITFIAGILPLTCIFELNLMSPQSPPLIYFTIIFLAAIVTFILSSKSHICSLISNSLTATVIPLGLLMSFIYIYDRDNLWFAIPYAVGTIVITFLYAVLHKRNGVRVFFSCLFPFTELLSLGILYYIKNETMFQPWFYVAFAIWGILFVIRKKYDRFSFISLAQGTLLLTSGFIGLCSDNSNVLINFLMFLMIMAYALFDNKRGLRGFAKFLAPIVSVIFTSSLIDKLNLDIYLTYIILFGIWCGFCILCAFIKDKFERLSEFTLPLKIYIASISAVFSIAMIINAYERTEINSILVSILWISSAFATALFFSEKKRNLYFYISASLYAISIFSTTALFFGEEKVIFALFITFGVITIYAISSLIYVKLERALYFSEYAMGTLSFIMILTSIFVDIGKIPMVLTFVPVILVFILGFIRKRNLFTAPALLMLCPYLIYFGNTNWNLGSAFALCAFSLTVLVGIILHKKVFEKSYVGVYIDWFTIGAIIPTLYLINCGGDKVWCFIGAILLAICPALYYKRVSDDTICNRLLLSLSGLFLCTAWWTKPFVIAEIVKLELDILPLFIYCFVLWNLWKEFRKHIENGGFVLAILGIILLSVDIFKYGYLADSLILLCSVFIMLLISFVIKKQRWFVLAGTMLLLITLFMTKDFWQSLAWWVYLLLVGILLIVIAAVNELGKQRTSSNTTKEKLRRFMNDWTW